MQDIWSGTQADPSLRAAELEDSRRNAAVVVHAMRSVATNLTAPDIETSALLVMHLGEATMRLAMSVDAKEGRKLVAGYKKLAVAHLERLFQSAHRHQGPRQRLAFGRSARYT